MSLWSDEPVTCSRCGRQSVVRLWKSLNAQLDPQARQDLLDGKLMRFECPGCGDSTVLNLPLLYNDMKLGYMVQFTAGGRAPDDASTRAAVAEIDAIKLFRFRAVDSMQRLQEKIWIFEAGADDRIVEIFKVYMARHDRKGMFPPGCEVYFLGFAEGRNGQEIALAVNADASAQVYLPAKKLVAVHQNMIRLVEAEQNLEGPHPLWRKIDEGWARRMLHYDE